jgi:putative transport protein
MQGLHWIFDQLRAYPEIAIFLVLALGYLLGSLKIGKFSLGSVTGVLLAGVLIGQLNITISPHVKSVFFLMFLFAVGYGVGPQFFRGLTHDGIPQVIFAAVFCVACLLSTFLVAKIAGFTVGQAAGLLSGACTISAVLGVATDSINQLGLPPDQAKPLLDAMPVAYAVTYLFGTAGSAWFLASMGPKILRCNLPEECKKLEEQMGAREPEAGVISAYRRFVARAYRIAVGDWVGKTVAEVEKRPLEKRLFVERIRQDGRIFDAEPGAVIAKDSVLVLSGRRETLLEVVGQIGEEVDDPELLDIPIQVLDVVVTSRALAGKTMEEIVKSPLMSEARGVYLRKILRSGQEMPIALRTIIDRGDVLQIAGSQRNTERLAAVIGYVDRPTDKSNVVMLGLGITLGALVGAVALKFGNVTVTLSTSGGALIAGLVCGWLRSVNRVFSRIPAPALWVFNNIGLTAFIAVVGISTGPSFVAGLKSAGLTLFVAGVIVTLMPFVVGLLMGKYIFKFHPAINLGVNAGARTTTAALGAIQDAARSKTPALGYTVPYAVGCILLTFWGVVIVLLMK